MRSYIVLVSPSYGGAEKRFFDVFTALRRRGADVRLIGPSSLVDQLRADHPERADVFEAFVPLQLARWSRLAFIRALRHTLRSLAPGSHFHYPMNCLWPLHLGRGDRVSMSAVDCGRVPALWGGTLTSAWTWLSFFFVQRIDVLSPTILTAMRHYRAAGRMSLTPGGTFLIPPQPGTAERAPVAAFLGRLVPGKGVDALLDMLPRLWERLRHRIVDGFAFEIAGYGPLQREVDARVESLSSEGIPVKFIGYAHAHTLFARSAVMLSLQEPTNYPSRVVAEALMAGCSAIVRDTGDSREFGELPGLVYCKAQLDPDELADQLSSLCARTLHEAGFQQKMRDAALARFSARHYIDYYHDLIVASYEPQAVCSQP